MRCSLALESISEGLGLKEVSAHFRDIVKEVSEMTRDLNYYALTDLWVNMDKALKSHFTK